MSKSENLQSLPMSYQFGYAQSLRHAYAGRVFPYAEQLEESPTRSPYATLHYASGSFAYYDKARTEYLMGCFLERLK